MKRISLAAVVVMVMASPYLARGEGVKLFGLKDVRLLDGPMKTAQQTDLKYILAHDPDRFLAPFRKEAGLPEKAKAYGSWESMGLGGQTCGHYLSALAMMWASTGDPECKRRLDYMVGELAECQKAFGTGYVGGVPNGKVLWDEIESGKLKVTGFGVNDRWVPWYNVHKTFAGLRDAYLVGENAQAKDVLVKMGDWCLGLMATLSDEQMQQMMGAEHGGMDEVLADIGAMTGDAKYIAAARRFCDAALLKPLEAGQDELTGKHANTQIPKVIGFERISQLTGDPDLHRAAEFFWEDVTEKRSVAIGGNSVDEHFHRTDDFSKMMEERTGPETCNTYNMLRLTEKLWEREPMEKYAAFYERAVWNHILSSQNPERGGFVYFTPMRPRSYRVYSTAEQCMWCCVGTGFENHAKYGAFVYGHSDDSLYVNLFAASEVTWKEKGLVLRQETAFPAEEAVTFKVSVEKPVRFALKVRKPQWSEAKVQGAVLKDGYWEIDREWKTGDEVKVVLPMKVTAERLPDGSDWVAFKYGPIVLAGVTGSEELVGLYAGDGRGDHIAKGPMLPMDGAPTVVVNDVTKVAEAVQREGDGFALAAAEPEAFKGMKLVPFYQVHGARYAVYFRAMTPAKWAAEKERLAGAEREKMALEQRTVDVVKPGEQQSEVDHGFKGEKTNSGTHGERSWRDARAWFSYEMKVQGGDELWATFLGSDRGREFEVFVGEARLAEVKLKGGREGFVVEKWTLPAGGSGTQTVKFVAKPGSIAGGVFEVRVVRK